MQPAEKLIFVSCDPSLEENWAYKIFMGLEPSFDEPKVIPFIIDED